MLALVVGAAYLWWRSSTVGSGLLLALSLPVLVLEVWSYLELAFLSVQAWRLPDQARRAPRENLDGETEIVILAAGLDIDALERTLIACDTVRGRGRIVVVDEARRYRHRKLAADAGASYRIDRRAATSPALAAHRNSTSAIYLWLTAGQLPTPDVLQVATSWFTDGDLAVCQLATTVLNLDDLAHLGRDRDDDALVAGVVGPALSRWGAAPWFGEASIVRRRAIDDIGGIDRHLPIERHVARLHRAGWSTGFEGRPLVAATAPEDLSLYLRLRRQRAGAALSVVCSADSPLRPGNGMRLGQRAAHLAAALRFGTGVRLALVALAAVAVLLSGRFPAEAPALAILGFWGCSAALGAAARRSLARGTLGSRDRIRQGWRVLGAEVGAVVDVVTRRVEPISLAREPQASVSGLRALAHLPLLDAVVVAIDLALLVRAATLVRQDLLHPFTTGQRVVVLGFAVALLVPVADVLQVVVLRQQRRASYRIASTLEATVDGVAVVTVDITPEGAGIVVPDEPEVGSIDAIEIALPGADDVIRTIAVRAEVRSARPDESGGWRVGYRFVSMPRPARRALVAFVSELPADEDDEELAVEAPVASAEFRRRRTLRRATILAGAAGLVTLVFGPGVASASTASPELVDRVCLVDGDGGPVAGGIVTRLRGDGTEVLGSTDATGCLVVAPVAETTGFTLGHRGAEYELGPGDYRATEARVALVEWRVRVVDLDARPVPGAEVRFFTDGWLAASAADDPANGHQLDGLPVDPAELSVEVTLDGARYVRTLGDRRNAVVIVPRVRFEAGVEGQPAIDRGFGWEPLANGADVLPGRVLIRTAAGDVLRLEVPESVEVRLPSGELVAVEVDVPDLAPTEDLIEAEIGVSGDDADAGDDDEPTDDGSTDDGSTDDEDGTDEVDRDDGEDRGNDEGGEPTVSSEPSTETTIAEDGGPDPSTTTAATDPTSRSSTTNTPGTDPSVSPPPSEAVESTSTSTGSSTSTVADGTTTTTTTDAGGGP